MAAFAESRELAESEDLLISSCCPAFVSYIKRNYPDLTGHISSSLSPMAVISKYIKEKEPDCKIVFIGPCTAKKLEIQSEAVKPYVDCAITFEELQALIDSKDIDIINLPERFLDNASYFGRIFARSGGLADSMRQGLKEQGFEDFDYNPISCSGIQECKTALSKASKGVLNHNFMEGMACISGCIGGAGCLRHEEKNKNDVDRYGMEAFEKTILSAIEILK